MMGKFSCEVTDVQTNPWTSSPKWTIFIKIIEIVSEDMGKVLYILNERSLIKLVGKLEGKKDGVVITDVDVRIPITLIMGQAQSNLFCECANKGTAMNEYLYRYVPARLGITSSLSSGFLRGLAIFALCMFV